MRTWVTDSAAPQQIAVLLFGDFSMHCLANVIEPLRAANGFAGREIYRWRFLSMDGATVMSSSGLSVEVHGPLASAAGDILFVAPSYRYDAHSTAENLRALRTASGRFEVVAGLDTGSWLMAKAGLLKGKVATIHWDVLDRFIDAFPDIETRRDRFVIDGSRVTCGGALAAFDLAIELIAQRHGEALRLEVATLFMSPEATGPLNVPNARGKTAARAIAVMRQNLEQPLPVGEIARRIGKNQKALEKRMYAELGATPQVVYKRLRLIEARKLALETDIRVSEIALRVGYDNPSAMTRAFRAEFGLTPSALRARL